MGIVMNSNDGSPRALQELARHQMIVKLYADILRDMEVCEIEGWDRMEYINMLRRALNELPELRRKDAKRKES